MTQVQSQQNNTLYQNMDLWRAKHEINISRCTSLLEFNNNDFERELNSNQSEDEKNYYMDRLDEDFDKIFNDYQSEREKIGLDFDFMEGKDPQNEDEYRAQVLKLAQGEIESKDIDNDSKLSLEEYVLAELQNYEDIPMKLAVEDTNKNGKFDDEEKEALTSRQEEYDEKTKENIKLTSIYMFNFMDDIMEHSNRDDYLSDEELADYYMHLDEYQGDGTKVRDGIINIDLAGEYPEYLINQVKEQTSEE